MFNCAVGANKLNKRGDNLKGHHSKLVFRGCGNSVLIKDSRRNSNVPRCVSVSVYVCVGLDVS